MTFAETLKTLRQKARKTNYRLAQYTSIDQSYIFRLEKGEKANPSRELVIMLGLALVSNSDAVTIHDVDELLMAAGYLPFKRRGEQLALLSTVA